MNPDFEFEWLGAVLTVMLLPVRFSVICGVVGDGPLLGLKKNKDLLQAPPVIECGRAWVSVGVAWHGPFLLIFRCVSTAVAYLWLGNGTIQRLILIFRGTHRSETEINQPSHNCFP